MKRVLSDLTAESLRLETTPQLKKQLIELVKSVSYREGQFVLSSGKTSTFYIDLKQTTLHPVGAVLVAHLGWRLLNPREFRAVGGPTMGADPIGTAMSFEAFQQGVYLPSFIIRKEPKKHGTSQWIEGRENLNADSAVLVVEDVVTTGGSSLKAIEKLRAEGFEVKHLFCILDRQEGGSEALAKAGVALHSLLKISDLQQGSH